MTDMPQPLTLEEIIAQGGYENNEHKWEKATITLHGEEYKALRDDKGFFYGPDGELYHTRTGSYDDGRLFTGISYELYRTGELELYIVYESSRIHETYRFFKNGVLKLYACPSRVRFYEFDETGSLIKKNGQPVQKVM